MSQSRTVRPWAGLIAGLASSLALAAPSLAPDPAFSPAGVQALASDAYGSFVASLRQADGRIVGVGTLGTGEGSDLLIARFDADGSLDTRFAFAGQSAIDYGASDDAARAATTLRDGRLLVAGQSGRLPLVAAFSADGLPDTGFAEQGRLRLALLGVSQGSFAAAQAHAAGGAWLVGEVLDADGGLRPLIARLHADGSLDRGFDGDGVRILSEEVGSASVLAAAADGGLFIGVRGAGRVRVLKLGADGSLDRGFGLDGSAEVTTQWASPLVALDVDAGGITLIERAAGRVTELALDGRLRRQSVLLDGGELAATTRAADGTRVVAIEVPGAGGMQAEAAVLERDGSGAFRLGDRLVLASAAGRALAVRSLDVDADRQVTLAGYQYGGADTDPWLGRITLQQAVASAPAPATPAGVTTPTAAPAESGGGGAGGAELLVLALALLSLGFRRVVRAR